VRRPTDHHASGKQGNPGDDQGNNEGAHAEQVGSRGSSAPRENATSDAAPASKGEGRCLWGPVVSLIPVGRLLSLAPRAARPGHDHLML
jgi:hypothetical protein